MMEVKVMEQIINLIMSNGLAVVIVAYFLFKDYKFNQQTIDVLQEIKEVLAVVKTYIDPQK